MKLKNILAAVLATGAFTALSAGSAFAAGTAAETNVQNTFSLTYSVDGTAQPPIDTSGGVPGTPGGPTEFTVDRKVDLTVADNGNNTVAPGEQDALLTYTLTNTGNDTQAYDLSLFNGVDATDDEFDATGLTITYYVGNSPVGTELSYTPGTSTVDVPADGQLYVVVSGDIPVAPGVEDDDTSDVTLVARTAEPDTLPGGAAGSGPGTTGGTTVLVTADGDTTNTITGAAENVLADGNGATGQEIDNDGAFSATATYTVTSADLSAAKTVGIIDQAGTACVASPPTTLAAFPTDQYSIPGACVEYRITVVNSGTNSSGTTDAMATNLNLLDVLPTGVTFAGASQTGFVGGTLNAPAPGTVCDGRPAAGTACTVELVSTPSSATLDAGTTGVIVIHATINN
jgi:hypothetical protein